MLGQLPEDPERSLSRVAFHVIDGPDPRHVLAKTSDLSAEDLAEISTRLMRMDRASRFGAWTQSALNMIAEHPGRRASDLAEMVGREPAMFKRDVRKLKNLGLTMSLPTGYCLSPRGEGYLESLHEPGSEDI